MRKRIFILLLSLVSFLVSSCGTSSEKYEPTQTEQSTLSDKSETPENDNGKLSQEPDSLDSTKTNEQNPEKSSKTVCA